MDHRDVAIFKSKPSGFQGSTVLTKFFLVPVPIEIGIEAVELLKISDF